jgi:hypothetical protein
MQDGELTGPLSALKHWKVVVTLQHAAEHICRPIGLYLHLEHGTQASEMDKHRLAIPPVAAIPGMLSHVGIDNDAMR